MICGQFKQLIYNVLYHEVSNGEALGVISEAQITIENTDLEIFIKVQNGHYGARFL